MVNRTGFEVSASWTMREKGASFCQVERIKPVVSGIPWSTSGSQKCIGANPIFRANPDRASAEAAGWAISVISQRPVNQALVMLANKITAAAVDWVRKYLVVASTARGWCWRAIRGIIANVLISKPIQAKSQWELEKVNTVPRPRLIMKRLTT